MPEPIDRWHLVDGDYALEIWREAALLDVVRGADGRIVSCRTPDRYAEADVIAAWELGWHRTPQDEQRRAMYAEIVNAHNDREQLRRDLQTAQGEIEMHIALIVDLHAQLEQARAVPAGQDGTP